MSTTILNRIITLSIVGILVLLVQDAFFKPKRASHQQITKQIITAAPAQKTLPYDPPVACSHPYFPFIKNSQWTYRVISATNISDKQKSNIRTLTNTLIDISTSSATIQNVLNDDDSNKKVSLTIYCRKSGIYGIPFSLSVKSDDTTGTILNTILASFSSQLLLLPPDTVLEKGATWTTPLSLGAGYGILDTGISVSLVNRVVKVSEQTLFGKRRRVVQVDASYKIPLFTLQLAEGVGITSFDLNLTYKNVSDVKLNLKLLKFTQQTRLSP